MPEEARRVPCTCAPHSGLPSCHSLWGNLPGLCPRASLTDPSFCRCPPLGAPHDLRREPGRGQTAPRTANQQRPRAESEPQLTGTAPGRGTRGAAEQLLGALTALRGKTWGGRDRGTPTLGILPPGAYQGLGGENRRKFRAASGGGRVAAGCYGA